MQVTLAACVTLLPRVSAAAEDRVGARSAAEEGTRALDEGRYQDAVQLFRKAESLYHAPPHLLLLARAHAAQGNLVQAQESYMMVVNENLPASAPKAFHNAQSEARSELQALKGRIPKLTVNVAEEYTELSITLDGQPYSLTLLGVPKPIDPGEHVLVVTARGKTRTEQRFSIAEGARENLSLELEDDTTTGTAPAPSAATTEASAPAPASADAAPASPSRTTLGYALIGGGVLFVGIGSYFGLAAKSQRDDALGNDALCGGSGCTPSGREEIDSATTKAHIATGGFALGAAALGVGAYFLFTGAEPSREVGLLPVVSPDTVGFSYQGAL